MEINLCIPPTIVPNINITAPVHPAIIISLSLGPSGEPGAPGLDGIGVPAGGTQGQVLEKIDGTDHATQWTSLNSLRQQLENALL